MKAGEYEITLKQKRPKVIPKKFLKSKQLRVTDHYFCNATLWIADTPESNYLPTVNLTVDHNGKKLRFCFHSAADLVIFVEELRYFISGLAPTLEKSQAIAVDEFLDFHRDKEVHIIDNHTVNTVIQEDSLNHDEKQRVRVDLKTGEIVGGGARIN